MEGHITSDCEDRYHDDEDDQDSYDDFQGNEDEYPMPNKAAPLTKVKNFRTLHMIFFLFSWFSLLFSPRDTPYA